jgi:NAD(P)-dependent dehydrogenase (short-subunit alcohol dehydrogenase family)
MQSLPTRRGSTRTTATDIRAAVITGASTGIGRATALHLARGGWQVFAGVRNARDAESLRSEGMPFLRPLMIDVTDGASIERAAAEVHSALNGRGLDGLVNNAGVGVAVPVEYVQLDVLRKNFEVNVFGQIAVIQAFLPLVRAARGRIVNIGSVGDRLTIPFGGILCGSKSAFASLSDALRLELHAFGIHVALVEPASIHTPAVEKTLGDMDRTIADLSAEGATRYGAMLRAFAERAYRREKAGTSPDAVGRTVERALTAVRPRARYLVGKDSTLLATLARFMPTRLLDVVRLRIFGLPRVFGAAAHVN